MTVPRRRTPSTRATASETAQTPLHRTATAPVRFRVKGLHAQQLPARPHAPLAWSSACALLPAEAVFMALRQLGACHVHGLAMRLSCSPPADTYCS